MRIAEVPDEIRTANPSKESPERYRYGNALRNIPGNHCNEQEVVGRTNRVLSVDATRTT
jgi:hypothetical protein